MLRRLTNCRSLLLLLLLIFARIYVFLRCKTTLWDTICWSNSGEIHLILSLGIWICSCTYPYVYYMYDFWCDCRLTSHGSITLAVWAMNYTVSQKMCQLWNGITQSYKNQFMYIQQLRWDLNKLFLVVLTAPQLTALDSNHQRPWTVLGHEYLKTCGTRPS